MSTQYSSIGVSVDVKKQFDFALMQYILKTKTKISPSEYIQKLIGKNHK